MRDRLTTWWRAITRSLMRALGEVWRAVEEVWEEVVLASTDFWAEAKDVTLDVISFAGRMLEVIAPVMVIGAFIGVWVGGSPVVWALAFPFIVAAIFFVLATIHIV